MTLRKASDLDGRLLWMLVIEDKHGETETEFYETEREAKEAAETAMDGTDGVNFYIALIKWQTE